MKIMTIDEALSQCHQELNLVHRCLTDLYEYQYDNQNDRIVRIKECLSEIDKIYAHLKNNS